MHGAVRSIILLFDSLVCMLRCLCHAGVVSALDRDYLAAQLASRAGRPVGASSRVHRQERVVQVGRHCVMRTCECVQRLPILLWLVWTGSRSLAYMDKIKHRRWQLGCNAEGLLHSCNCLVRCRGSDDSAKYSDD
jgi:hypothetical protein